jgi:hypothetical protein
MIDTLCYPNELDKKWPLKYFNAMSAKEKLKLIREYYPFITKAYPVVYEDEMGNIYTLIKCLTKKSNTMNGQTKINQNQFGQYIVIEKKVLSRIEPDLNQDGTLRIDKSKSSGQDIIWLKQMLETRENTYRDFSSMKTNTAEKYYRYMAVPVNRENTLPVQEYLSKLKQNLQKHNWRIGIQFIYARQITNPTGKEKQISNGLYIVNRRLVKLTDKNTVQDIIYNTYTYRTQQSQQQFPSDSIHDDNLAATNTVPNNQNNGTVGGSKDPWRGF